MARSSFFVGDVKRAPEWVSRSGFEWLYRLAMEPRRLWRRYLIEDIAAFPVFLGMLLQRMTGHSLAEPHVVVPAVSRRKSVRRHRRVTYGPVSTPAAAAPERVEALAR